MTDTLQLRLIASLRAAAEAFAPGDQVAPCAVLWLDPERQWAEVVPTIQTAMPELYQLGAYEPTKRIGPALWLRCIEGRVIQGAASEGTTPVFYLPGISREQLRAVEDCSMEVAALVELQFRGVLWLHTNGKEWTPYGFLVSNHGGMNLDVPRDQATLDALARALPRMMSEPAPAYLTRRLDADFFNALLAPDPTGLLLQWLSDPEGFEKGRPPASWQAFCQQTKTEFGLDPVKDGPLKAARNLASRANAWEAVWKRYADTPQNYPGVVEWLRRAAPREPSMFDSAEVWPSMNEAKERELLQSLTSLADRPQGEVIKRLATLDTDHSQRRSYAWAKLGLSPWATVLEPLARLAAACEKSPGAPSAHAFADYYASAGWKADAACIATLSVAAEHNGAGPVLEVLRALYLPWLETTSRLLQSILSTESNPVAKKMPPPKAVPGRVVIFADGLRMDIAHAVRGRLEAGGLVAEMEWEWSTIPSVTATAKPAASPIASHFTGTEVGAGFATRLVATGQASSQDRFVTTLWANGWQFLSGNETGDPTQSAWTEAGTVDKRGHNEGWKLARSIETEVRDLANRIAALLSAGWTEVILVTDHGWLLLPGGLPKVELKSFLAEDRWGRCASLKANAQPGVTVYPWHWNPAVEIACPTGVGCYRSGMEYTHGGISLQEMVTPRLTVRASRAKSTSTAISEVKWTGAKCRVSVSGNGVGMRVDLRTVPSDAKTSLLSDQTAREVTYDNKATLFLEDDSDLGRTAEVVLVSSTGQVIHSVTTELGK
jgi:hypothetical protein